MLKYQTVLLDLDGTLVDSAPGIVSTIAYTLRAMGREVPSTQELRHWVGPPLPQSFEREAQMSPEEAAEAIHLYRERYLEVGVYDAQVFDGIPSLISELKDAGAHLAIATSKPLTPATIMLEHFTLAHQMDAIAGAADDETRGAKKHVIEDALAALSNRGLNTDSIIMVGDRIQDVEGAAHHGIETILVRWGYGGPTEWEQASHVVDTAHQLHQALGIPGGQA